MKPFLLLNQLYKFQVCTNLFAISYDELHLFVDQDTLFSN